MTRVITILSGKGGVGKTTLTFNLGVALTDMGKNVLIIDGNLTTPNLGIHAGIPAYENTLHDVLKGKIDIFDAIRILPYGLKILPASINVRDLEGLNPELLPAYIIDLVGKIDIVLIDGAAGLGREAVSALKASDEVLGITTPDIPALTDLIRLAKIAERLKKIYTGTVINRVSNKSYEVSKEQISSFLEDLPILETIPEDKSIPLALKKRVPVLHLNPKARASRKIIAIAHKILGLEYKEKIPWRERLLKFFGLSLD